MASEPKGQLPQREASDLAELWQSAIKEYNERTNSKLQTGPWSSVDEIVRDTKGLMTRFKDFRGDETKVGRVRGVFTKNMWLIKKTLNAFQVLGNAAAAFPPAMPASLIFTVFGNVMQSFADQSADYDKVLGFFEFMRRFLDRLSIIEDKSPQEAPFQRCLVLVFSSMLTICGIAQEYAQSKRLKKWFGNLLHGTEDPQLAGAYSGMETAINELSEAVGLATLKRVEVIGDIVRSIEEKTDLLIGKVDIIDERVIAIKDDTAIIIAKQEIMSERAHAMQSDNRRILKKQDMMYEDFSKMLNILQRSEKQSNMPDKMQDKKEAQIAQHKAKFDPAEKRLQALNQIDIGFENRLVNAWRWKSVRKEMAVQKAEIASMHVRATGAWVLEEENYKNWLNEKFPILWIRGPAGIGKSFLTTRIATDLASRNKSRKSSSWFFFREEQTDLRSWDYAMACLAYHIAEQDGRYCEQLATEMSIHSEEDTWTRLFADKFPENEDGNIFLILDGVDEIEPSQRQSLFTCLRQVTEKNLKIHIVFTSRPDVVELDEMKLPTIEVTVKKLSTDMDKVILSGCSSLSRLKKFRRPVINHIRRQIKKKADGMRYIEHVLRRLNYIGRENAVVKEINNRLPDDTSALYHMMITECQKDRTNEQYHALKKLFAWLAYSKRTLTLKEASELVALTVHDSAVFDIEEELIGRSARILDIAKTADELDDDDESIDNKPQGSEVDDDGELDTSDSGHARLTFQERSLREYFQAVDVDDHGLRTSPSAAHLVIFEMAADALFKPCSRPNYSGELNLLQYSANFWAEHFLEIDINTATDDDVSRVVTLLHKILNNHNNTASTMEYFSYRTYSFLLPDGASLWLERVKEWVERYTSLDEQLTANPVREWADAFDPHKALWCLARGHVENWYREYFHIANSEALRFAQDALKMCGVEFSDNEQENIFKVAGQFPDIEQGAGAMRAISCSLATLYLYDEALEYIEKGLRMVDEDDKILQAYLYWSLANYYSSNDKHEESLANVDKAIAALPSTWKADEDLFRMGCSMHWKRAQELRRLERNEEAVKAYNLLKSYDWDDIPIGNILNDITNVVDEESDPEASQLLQVLQGWSEKELQAWISWSFDSQNDLAKAKLQRLAAVNGAEGRELVLRTYNSYLASIPPRSDQVIPVQVALADLYQGPLNNQEKARELYNSIVKRPVQNIEDYYITTQIQQARSSLVDVIFGDFRNESDPRKKSELLLEMKGIPLRNMDNENGFILMTESSISVMLALMYRVLGPVTEFQTTLQEAFDACIDGLSDSVGWNDVSSLRLLAKILSCVPGLERDALIAVSCQFSLITEEPDDDDASSDEQGDAINKMDDSPSPDKLVTADSTQPVDEAGSTTELVDEISRTVTVTMSVVSSTEIDKNTTIPETSSKTEMMDRIDSVHEEKIILSEAGGQGQETLEILLTDERRSGETFPEIEDEQLNDSPVWCDGCMREWRSWKEPIYLCLICNCNTDLCSDCHAKLTGRMTDDSNDSGRAFCGESHVYLRGPITGWNGVKDGVMRIRKGEGDMEELEIKAWLQSLKAERWPAAWNAYWLTTHGLRNIS